MFFIEIEGFIGFWFFLIFFELLVIVCLFVYVICRLSRWDGIIVVDCFVEDCIDDVVVEGNVSFYGVERSFWEKVKLVEWIFEVEDDGVNYIEVIVYIKSIVKCYEMLWGEKFVFW